MPAADINLLKAVLAMQFGLVSRDQVLDAMSAWIGDKQTPIEQIFRRQGSLSEESLGKLVALIGMHLELHGNDVEKSLAALNSVSGMGEKLKGLKDADLEASLNHFSIAATEAPSGHDPFQTQAVGDQSSHGMRFKILRPHARGGLGEVSVAYDQELNREVALKEIQARHADHLESRMRFVIEAQITGGLEHPSIVPVYGMGTYPDGRPFYAMRFIRGASLKDGINDLYESLASQTSQGAGQDTGSSHRPLKNLPSLAFQSLAFRQLLGRLVDVCNAVAYAHARGVLHRDLKPANIMLGKFGETLVVDWGLAKATGKSDSSLDSSQPPLTASTESGSSETQHGSTLGTPGYMSPEQASGRVDQFGPATDIYCLGATLYHLLTGRPPHRNSPDGKLLQMIVEGRFSPPREVNRAIPPPLAAICLKAMATAPQDRYITAKDVACDLEAWLSDETVTAYPESSLDQAWRWVRRHRAWALTASGSLAVVALIAIIAVVVVRSAQKQTEIYRRDAVARLGDARQAVDEWLTGSSDLLQYYPGVRAARERMLERAASTYDQFSSVGGGDPDLDFERGRSYIRLGDVKRSLRDYDSAETAYIRAKELFLELEQRGIQTDAARLEQARAQVKQAIVLRERGQSQQSLDMLNGSLKAISGANISGALHPLAQEIQGVALLNRGSLLLDLGNLEDARNSIVDSQILFAASMASQPAKQLYARNEAAAALLLGQLSLRLGDTQVAVDTLRGAVESLKRLVATEPDHPEYRRSLADAWVLQAESQRSQGDQAGAENSYLAAANDYRALAQAIPDDPQYSDSLALTQIDMALLFLKRGQAFAARTEIIPAQNHFSVAMKEFPEAYGEQFAVATAVLGQASFELGEYDIAREHSEAAVGALVEIVGEQPNIPDYQELLALVRSQLAQSYCRDGEIERSGKLWAEALTDLRHLADSNPKVERFRFDQAAVASAASESMLAAGRRSEAEVYLRRATEIWRALGRDSNDVERLQEASWRIINAPFVEFRDLNAAAIAVQRGLDLSPAGDSLLVAQGALQFRREDLSAAGDTLERAAKLRRDANAKLNLFQAMLQARLGDQEAAEKKLAIAVNWVAVNQPGNLEIRRLLTEAKEVVFDSKTPSPQHP